MSLFVDGVTALRRFADYQGRSTRTDLGAFWLVSVVAGLILLATTAILEATIVPYFPLTALVQSAYQGILMIPMLALFARRMHDRGLSGWWAALCVPVTIQNIVADYDLLSDDMETMLAIKHSTWHFIAGLLLLLVFALLLAPGDEGPNRFGPNPRFGRDGEPA